MMNNNSVLYPGTSEGAGMGGKGKKREIAISRVRRHENVQTVCGADIGKVGE